MGFRQNKKEALARLLDIEIFKGIPENLLLVLADELRTTTAKQGETIKEAHAGVQRLFIVESGRAQVMRLAETPFVSEISAGESFGEYSLLDAAAEENVAAVAATDCQLWTLNRADFERIVSLYPSISLHINAILLRQLREAHEQAEQLSDMATKAEIDNRKLRHDNTLLDNEYHESQRLHKTKDTFFSIIAHDLRNPFNAILGLGDLLLSDFDSYDREQIKSYVEQIHHYNGKTYDLLDNLLQWARTQTGTLKIRKRLANVRDLVEETRDTLLGISTPKEIEIDVDTHTLLTEMDVNMIGTVLRNLITNAVKFTRPGGKVEVRYTADDHLVHVWVKDNGIGISAEDQQKLFKIEHNNATIGTGEGKGTGLGLILSKEFVTQHGGEIDVRSELGQGSTFHFTMPCSIPEE